MLFKQPEIDVERHVEMRIRRVFPISLEASLKQSYEEALKKLKEATELERQAYQLTMEKAILEQRLSIWDWLGKNLEELSRALSTGNYENVKSLIQAIKEEADKRWQEERNLLNKVESGESISKQIGAPTITKTYSSSGSSSGSNVVITYQPTQPSSSISRPSTDQRTEVLNKLETQAKQTGQTYIVPAKDFGAMGGYYVITPQGGYSTANPQLYTQGSPTNSSLSSPANISTFNPFQKSGFYNPFR